jgi:hypothetical protein
VTDATTPADLAPSEIAATACPACGHELQGILTESVEEALRRRREQRHDALRAVMDLWAQHRLGEEPGLPDLVATAEWVATGDTSPLERLDAALGQRALAARRTDPPDAATWSPG